MADMQDICLEPTFKFLLCKLHGYGVHPTKEAITRHLRGEYHHCRGEALKQVISSLTNLSLSSLEAMRDAQPTVDAQPVVPPLAHLRVLHGWNCVPCAGNFLTASLEIVQRHAAATHGRRRRDQPLWEACKMQTFFSETKDRRYFRVANLPATTSEEDIQEQNGREGLQHVQAWRKMVDLRNKITRRTNSYSSLMSNPLAKENKSSCRKRHKSFGISNFLSSTIKDVLEPSTAPYILASFYALCREVRAPTRSSS